MNKLFSYQRASRSLFWLVTALLAAFAYLSVQFLHGQLMYLFLAFILFFQIYFIVLRLHDINRSGWNALWFFVPIVGWGISIYYLTRKGQKGQNYYGEIIH